MGYGGGIDGGKRGGNTCRALLLGCRHFKNWMVRDPMMGATVECRSKCKMRSEKGNFCRSEHVIFLYNGCDKIG